MPLTRDNLIDLSLKSLANGKALVEEAEILLGHRRWARSVFLCHTAGEKFGKCIACMTAAMDCARGKLAEKTFWKRFRSHHQKGTAIDYFETVMLNDGHSLDEKLAAVESEVSLMFEHRNVTLYTSMFADGIIAPVDAVDEKLATDVLKWPRNRVGLMQTLIEPLISSSFIRTIPDDAVREKFDEFLASLKDDKKREELIAEVEPFRPAREK